MYAALDLTLDLPLSKKYPKITWAWSSTLFSPLYKLSSASISFCWASFLFWSTLLVSWTFTTMPVGVCVSWTALLVFATAWPPGPEPLTVDSVMWFLSLRHNVFIFQCFLDFGLWQLTVWRQCERKTSSYWKSKHN